jgi:PDZ domain-containing protein
MTYLGRPVQTQVVVSAVYPDTPADGVLSPKDEFVSIDGTPVTEAVEVAKTIRAAPIGTSFDILVRRDGLELSVPVTSIANPDDPTVPQIGIGVDTLFSADFPIDFTLQDVGGPSAGLMFATGIVDKLTPGDLVGDHHIAGTGTIQPDGTVGPIGGIRQKLAGARNAGATLFVMPQKHCAEIEGHVPDGLTVVPVGTLSESVKAIQAYVAGEAVASCPSPVS